jgi:hypothetical protein
VTPCCPTSDDHRGRVGSLLLPSENPHVEPGRPCSLTCKPCPGTGVNHLSGLYTGGQGSLLLFFRAKNCLQGIFHP